MQDELAPRSVDETLDLPTSADTSQAPFTEVLAVISQDVVSAFSEPRPRTENGLFSCETRNRFNTHAYWLAARKLTERHFLDCRVTKPGGRAGVVDDAPHTNIKAVMSIKAARSNEVSRHGGLLSRF
jgi:hypothetical protein